MITIETQFRKPHPAKSWKQIQKANKELSDAWSREVGSAAFDMAWDLAVNDGGARIRELEAKRERLRQEQDLKAQDIDAACLLLGVREGSLGIKDGKVFGAQSLAYVDNIARQYRECLSVWNSVRVSAGLEPLEA